MKYFVYALHTKEKRITAALSCQDLKQAERAYGIAKRKWEAKNEDAPYYQFGYCRGNEEVELEFLVLPDWGTGRGWHTEKTFDIDDFVFAESETKENLLKGSQDPDIVFMRLVERAMTKQWLGFDPHEVLQESVTEPVIKTIDKSTAAITKELRRPWEKAPMPVNDNDAVAAIKENTAVLKEIREKIPAQKTHEPAVNSDKLAKKRRNKVSDMQYHAAIKLIIDEKMNQNDAETR